MRITKYTKEGIYINSYSTIKEGAVETNIEASNISRAINGERNLAGGFQWRKTNSIENIKESQKEVEENSILQLDKDSKKLIAKFTNATVAANYLGIPNSSAIAACASHKILPSGYSRATAHGYVWEWEYKIVSDRIVKELLSKTENEITLYRRWTGIKARCYNKNDTAYYQYGAIGVTMCKEWLANFESFKMWALSNGFKQELEIDKDMLCDKLDIKPKIYSPSTCQWVTKQENMSYQNRKKTSKQIYQYTLDGNLIKQYNSIALASIATNIHHRSIAKVARDKRGSAGNFLWRFTKQENIKLNRKITKKIEQCDLNTGEIIAIHNHIDDAVKAVNGSRSTIYSVCNGSKKRAYGYMWKYL